VTAFAGTKRGFLDKLMGHRFINRFKKDSGDGCWWSMKQRLQKQARLGALPR